MKVKFLVSTAYKGPRKEGDVISVPDDFAKRWAKNGIAEIIEDDSNSNKNRTTHETSSKTADTADLSSLSAKELYELCVKKEINVEVKKGKEYYLEKLAEAEQEA